MSSLAADLINGMISSAVWKEINMLASRDKMFEVQGQSHTTIDQTKL